MAFKQAVDQLSVNIVHGMQPEINTADPAGSVTVQHADFLADRGGEAGLPSVKADLAFPCLGKHVVGFVIIFLVQVIVESADPFHGLFRS